MGVGAEVGEAGEDVFGGAVEVGCVDYGGVRGLVLVLLVVGVEVLMWMGRVRMRVRVH